MTSRSRFALSLASTVVILFLASGPMMRKALGDTGYTQLSIFHEVVSLIRDTYVDPVNMDRTLNAAEAGLLEALDGDSGYLEPQDFKALQAGRPNLAETGIVLGRRFGFLTVVATRPDSPARKAGLKAGDFIKTIDGRHTHVLSVPKGEQLLAGDPGSFVKVAIFKSGAEAVEYTIGRERPQGSAPVSRLLDGRVGYVALSEVGEGTAAAVRTVIADLQGQGARSVVLDLRSAATGAFGNAVSLFEVFLKTGVVAKVAGRNVADQTINANATAPVYSGPLAILVDRGTAGASEIVAGALVDAGRANLFGENTFGRAGIQKQIPLDSGGGLLLTVSRYLTPKGHSINGRGLQPKTAVRNPDGLENYGAPGKDPVLDKAIEALEAVATKAAA